MLASHPDFIEIIECFLAAKVEFVIVGAHAMAAHGKPRYTGHLDLLVNVTPSNVERVISALKDFGFHTPDLTNEDFVKPDSVIQLGFPPVRIDILTGISGVSFAEVWRNRKELELQGLRVSVISKEDLIINKKASGRPQDLLDAKTLDDS